MGQSEVVVRNYLYRGLTKLRSAILERSDAAQWVNAQRLSAQPVSGQFVTAKPEAEQKGLLIAEPGLP